MPREDTRARDLTDDQLIAALNRVHSNDTLDDRVEVYEQVEPEALTADELERLSEALEENRQEQKDCPICGADVFDGTRADHIRDEH